MTASTGVPGIIYLIHFDTPYKHAKHYLGWTRNLDERLTEHAAGRGANLMRVIKDADIGWTVARTWLGDRKYERSLKISGTARRGRCPVCRGDLPQYVSGAVPFETKESTPCVSAS